MSAHRRQPSVASSEGCVRCEKPVPSPRAGPESHPGTHPGPWSLAVGLAVCNVWSQALVFVLEAQPQRATSEWLRCKRVRRQVGAGVSSWQSRGGEIVGEHG